MSPREGDESETEDESESEKEGKTNVSREGPKGGFKPAMVEGDAG